MLTEFLLVYVNKNIYIVCISSPRLIASSCHTIATRQLTFSPGNKSWPVSLSL